MGIQLGILWKTVDAVAYRTKMGLLLDTPHDLPVHRKKSPPLADFTPLNPIPSPKMPPWFMLGTSHG